MSSSTKDILEELSLLSEKLDWMNSNLSEIIDFLSTHRPKINPDNYFRERLKQKIIDLGEENQIQKIKKSKKILSIIHGFYSQWMPLYTTAFSCLIIGIIIFQFKGAYIIPEGVLFPSMQPALYTGSGNVVEILRPKNSIALSWKLEENDAHEIDSEINGIIEDMNSIIGDTSPKVKSTSPQKGKIVPEMAKYSLDMWLSEITPSMAPLPGMLRSMAANSVMEKQEIQTSYIIPTYPSVVNIYKKYGPDFTQVELISHMGFGITGIEMETEKNMTLLQSKIEAKIWSDIVTAWWIITYIPMKKIGKDVPNTHYLIPVISYTLSSGKSIFIPIVRGFE